MATGQNIVNDALTYLALMDPSGTPSASDSTTCLQVLNNMWESWGVDEGLIYALVPFSGNLSTTVASYTIGSGATFDTRRPARIYKAYFVLGSNRNELKIVEAGEYFSHNDLTASAATPDELYADYNVDSDGFATLYLWPVPTFGSGSPTLQLLQGVNFTAWTLTDTYQIPQAYRDALGWALAFRCLPIFGEAVGQGAAQVVAAEGAKAEARLRTMNQKNRQLQPGDVMTPGAPQEPQRAA